MNNSLLSQEIVNSFVDCIKDDKVIEDDAVLERFMQLFESGGIPSVDDIKNVIFNEEFN